MSSPTRQAAATSADAAEPAASAIWQLRLLGAFSLDDGQQTLTRLQSRSATVLLTRLALAPERHHAREELADLLWPDAEAAAARNRLRQTLFGLKAVLEPPGGSAVLLADRRVVRLVPGTLWCDVPAFEQALRDKRVDAARALYRGELLPGLFDEWVHEERQRLQALADRLGDPLSLPASAAPSGPSAVALPRSTRTLPPKPVRAPAGSPAAARPTGTLSRALRLPHYLTRLVGADLSGARLRDGVLQHRFLTVLGAGGAGKTRLAVEVARFLSQGDANRDASGGAPAFERVIFVPLVGCVGAASLLDRLLLSLQIGSAGDVFEKLLAALEEQRLLVVLDNAEQLDDDAVAAIARLVEQLPRVHWLVTSRRPLGLDGEQRFVLQPLELPAAAAPLAEVAMNAAVALFVDRVRAHRLDFRVHEANRDSVVALVGWLGGLPLAIELAASRSHTLGPAQVLALLTGAGESPGQAGAGEAALAWLARRGPRGGRDDRQASMLAVIRWSWDLLGAAQQRMLLAVSALPGGASVAAAAALASRGGEPTGPTQAAPRTPLSPLAARALLDELVDHSLLQLEWRAGSGAGSGPSPTSEPPADPPARYVVNPAIREFAAGRLDAAGAARQRAALRGWAAGWAGSLPATPPLAEVREELPNVVTALASALADGCGDEALAIVLSLQSSWGEIALPSAVLDLLAQVLALPGLSAPLAAGGHALAAWSCYEAGRRDAALAHAEQALARLPEVQDDAVRANVMHRVARMRWRIGRDAPAARALLAQALPLAIAQRLHGVHGALVGLEAHLAAAVDRDPARAAQLTAQALALCRLTGNAHLVNAHRFNLAVTRILDGQHAEALPELQALAEEGRVLGDWDLAAGALDAAGTALLALRRWREAAQAHRESLVIAWQAMDPLATIFALWNIGPSLARLRQPRLAAQTMGFAALTWPHRFGEFDANDLRDLRRVRRFVRCLLPAAQAEAAWSAGRAMSLAEAVRAVLMSELMPTEPAAPHRPPVAEPAQRS